MTPADLAVKNAITFEAKKDSLRQTQDGTWKIAFTVQGIDMDERLTKAFPGTRYVAVLVEVNDDETPVTKERKEAMPHSEGNKRAPTGLHNARLQSDSPSAGAKRDWKDIQPSAQAAMLCDKPVFRAFLREQHADEWTESMADPAECVRLICAVQSRSMLNEGAARVIWHQLQTEYQAWERVGA